MQFGKAIIEFPAVYDMLALMKAKLDAGRSLLYQTSRYVDIYKALDDIARERERLAWQIGELDKLAPQDDEWEELNTSHSRLARRSTRRGRHTTSTSTATEASAPGWRSAKRWACAQACAAGMPSPASHSRCLGRHQLGLGFSQPNPLPGKCSLGVSYLSQMRLHVQLARLFAFQVVRK